MQPSAIWRSRPTTRDVLVRFARYFVILSLVVAGLAPVVLFAQTVTEARKVIPSAVETGDQIGRSVAISGSTVLAGAIFDDDRGTDAGAVYQIDASSGTVVRKITPDDGASLDAFGVAVAVAGNIAVIGASQNDSAGRSAGAAYVYDTGNGRQISRLLPFAPTINDPSGQFFGRATAVSDNFIVVGAPGDLEQDSGAGSAYIYTTGNNPRLIGKIFASDPGFADNFGRQVAVSNTSAVIASPFDNDNGDDSGSVYLFDAATAQQQRKITPNDGAAGDLFGLGLAIGDAIIAVGAPFADVSGADSGAVYLFDVTTGQQLAKLTPDDGAAGDRFGESVAISGSTLVVGALADDGVGSAYVFDLATGAQQAKLVASDRQDGDAFGFSVAISGSQVVVGAPGDDDVGSLSGSIYIFDLDGSPVPPTATNPSETPTPTGVPPTATAVPPTPTSAPPTATPLPTATPPAGSGPDTLYLSLLSDGNGFSDEDILTYDIPNDQLALFFDGSDVGLASANVDAFALLNDGSLLLSFSDPFIVGGINADDSDVLRFVPTSLGSDTAGSFSLYVDGSDIGLTNDREDIDALEVVSEDGSGLTLLVSTNGFLRVPGAVARDEDLVQLTLSQTGDTTTGTWSPFFDGSDVGLASGAEDVWGAALVDGDLYLTTAGAFSVDGASGGGADVLRCSTLTTGTPTSCVFSLFLDGATIGIDGNVMDSMLLRSGSAVLP